MTEHASPSTPADSGSGADDPLAQAAAAGPLPGAALSAADPAESAEPATVHDSPAGVDEARAADRDADGDELVDTDPLNTIYGPPPGDRQ